MKGGRSEEGSTPLREGGNQRAKELLSDEERSLLREKGRWWRERGIYAQKESAITTIGFLNRRKRN